MLTPYDWQEGIGNRAQYIDAKLAHGAPVIAVSASDGILLVTYRRQSRKLFEVYDRLAFGAIGQQSDVEAIRMAAVEFASREGYQRSEQDVTIQRVVTAISQPLKKAFSDFSTSPFVARCLFAEVGEQVSDDLYHTIDYTGDYAATRSAAAIAGTLETQDETLKKLLELDFAMDGESLLPAVQDAWKSAWATEESENMDGLSLEALIVMRSAEREDRFRFLTSVDY